MSHWTELPVLSLDTETTSKYSAEARIVEAGAVLVHPDLSATDERRWLINPGVEIPAGATEVHGITTEQVQAEGVEPAGALQDLADLVWQHVVEHRGQAAVAIFNAPYDLPLIIAECRRHDVDWPAFAGILDPLVVDRACDFWRRDEHVHFKPVAQTHAGGWEQAKKHRYGNRKLIRLAELYGVELGDNAHGAIPDATATGRVLFRIAERFPQVTRHGLATMWFKQVLAADKALDKIRDHIRQGGDPLADVAGGWPLPARESKDPAKVPAPRVSTGRRAVPEPPKSPVGQQSENQTANDPVADPVLAQAGGPAGDCPPAGTPADHVPMDAAQNRRVHALIAKARPGQDRHAVMTELLGRPVTTAKTLSNDDADRIVEALDAEKRAAS